MNDNLLLSSSSSSAASVMQLEQWPSDGYLSLTLSYGLMLVVSQRGNKEVHLSHGAPVVQDADAPHTGAQGLVERGAVVGELGAGVDQNVIGGGDDVGGVNPHNCDGDIGTFTPLLHANCLVHGAHHAAEVSEHTFFGIPLCADLWIDEEEGIKWAEGVSVRNSCEYI